MKWWERRRIRRETDALAAVIEALREHGYSGLYDLHNATGLSARRIVRVLDDLLMLAVVEDRWVDCPRGPRRRVYGLVFPWR